MVLNRITLLRGSPKVLFCDNGSEFTSQAMDIWAYRNGVRIDFSRPGKPTDNAFESLNGTFRTECLDVHWFASIAEPRQLIEVWRWEYNESRPHRALGEQTPSEYASQFATQREQTSLAGDRKLTLGMAQKTRATQTLMILTSTWMRKSTQVTL